MLAISAFQSAFNHCQITNGFESCFKCYMIKFILWIRFFQKIIFKYLFLVYLCRCECSYSFLKLIQSYFLSLKLHFKAITCH